VGFGSRALAALGKVGIVLAILVAFLFGLTGTIYLSLRTSEVTVPDVLGKDRLTAETMLDDVGLKIRVRGARPSAEKPDTILSQLPEAGQVVKVGIPVAVEVSRAPKEGESVRSSTEEPSQEQPAKPAENANANQAQTATNQNQNQNKAPKNKNANRNANNANNSNNVNRNANASRNANDRNANATRNTSNGNRNANTTPNTNRTTNNSNTNRRPPVMTTPPFNPGANRGTP
jgi:hypothetical protein